MRNTWKRLLAAVCVLSLSLVGYVRLSGADPIIQEAEPGTAMAPEDSGGDKETVDKTGAGSVEREGVTILVAAAASLEHSFVEELIPLFEDMYPWITVAGTYDSSGKLQTQIESGLEADVFMCASMMQMSGLVEQNLVDEGSVVQLLENRIVLIAPWDSTTGIASFGDLAAADTVALGDPESVPVGQYAREALTSLGIYDDIAARASFGSNVTEVLNWVAEGSAQVGIVYATDAATTDRVKILAEAPEGITEPVIYPVGVVADSANKDAAQLFVEFLQSDEAIAIFEEYGFAKYESL